MHTGTRTWNVPLGIGLFGAAVLLGGAILAYPEAHRAPSKVDVSDPIATRPFPSFPEEVPAVKGNRVNNPAPLDSTSVPQSINVAPKAIGGGPVAEETSTTRSATSAMPAPLPAPTTAATNPIAPTPTATAPPLPTTTTTTTTTASDAGVAQSNLSTTASEAGTQASDASFAEASSAVGDANGGMDYSGTPYIVPNFGGAPVSGTGTGDLTVPISDGGLGIAGGGGGGGSSTTTTTNTNVDAGTTAVDAGPPVNKINLTAPLLVPMSATSEPVWAAMKPFVHGGDVLVNRDSAALGFAERIKTDAPTVTYVVAFETAATLQSALDKLPAALPGVGVSAAGLTESALTTLSTKVHGTGRKLFISTNVPPNGPSLAAIGQRADVVELVIASDVANAAKTAIASLGTKPMVFIRLPGSATTNTTIALAQEIVTANPKAGVALPLSDDMGTVLSDYRSH